MLYIAFDPIYAHPLPEGHRFPMLKYELIPGQLLYEGTISIASLHGPAACPLEIVALTHTEQYIDKLIHQSLSAKEQRQIGFPQSPELTQRELVITQGTIDCSLHALQHGVALNVAGGTHHAFADHGEGFCLLNDFAVAANYLLSKKLVKQVLVVDLDVHQGNGTAKIFESNSNVFTFSMHGKHNYPFHKETSDLDIELPDGIRDAEYLDILYQQLPKLVDTIRPDIVYYLSGVDILATDKFGKLKISMDACRQRDRYVLATMFNRKIPVAVSMGGGYSPDVKTIVEAHCNTFRLAKEIYDL
jgi:acetoin utilization deacetylase AcuC-like enzyme